MVYIISLVKNSIGKIVEYTGFDTYSDSVMDITPDELKCIILNTNMQVVNAGVQNGEITLKKWANRIRTFIGEELGCGSVGSKYVLLATSEDDKYKICDHHGDVEYINKKKLKMLVRSGDIANCNYKLGVTDVYNIETNKEFEDGIRSKYEIFIAKTTMLGMQGMTFRYSIENIEVRLTEYTGYNRNVVLPPFITAIEKFAFSNSDVLTLKLNEGLKAIDLCAFVFKPIAKMEIPKTVELICNEAFVDNHRATDIKSTLNKNRFKLQNRETIVLRQGTKE